MSGAVPDGTDFELFQQLGEGDAGRGPGGIVALDSFPHCLTEREDELACICHKFSHINVEPKARYIPACRQRMKMLVCLYYSTQQPVPTNPQVAPTTTLLA